MGILKKYIVVSLMSITFVSCAKKFDSVLRRADKIQNIENIGQSTLEGSLQLEDSSEVALSTFNDKPLLLFFVSETCSSCREETEHLLAEIAAKGLPSNINILSVLIGSLPDDISYWRDSFSQPVTWSIGVDADLVLYRKYFNELKTPSIMFFNPETQILKKWQQAVSIETLKKETIPWN